MTFDEIITTTDQAVINEAVLDICWYMRLLSFFVPFIPEFLNERTDGPPVAVDKQRQGM